VSDVDSDQLQLVFALSLLTRCCCNTGNWGLYSEFLKPPRGAGFLAQCAAIGEPFTPVGIDNSNPHIMVMKAAENRSRRHSQYGGK
jgi:hypothetical protein